MKNSTSKWMAVLASGVAMSSLVATPATAQERKTIEMDRHTFQPNYWEDTDHGVATLAAADVKSDDGSDIAFSALNDTLTMTVTGAAGVSNPVAGFAIGKAVSEITSLLQDNDKQFARLAKFSNSDATFLQYDDGSWCIIPGGGDLDHIERDSLEPMDRYDIPADAGSQTCRSPDGFYEASDGTVFFLYSSTAQDKSWYGIGFGDSYCGLANPTDWLVTANMAFPNDRDKANIRQGTKFKLDTNIDGVARGRTYRGRCGPGTPHNFKIRLTAEQQTSERKILFNDHWTRTGHGASLYYKAKGGNALGDALTDDTANFLAGFSDSTPMAFYGTGATILSKFTADETSLPRMAKRPNADAVYLQQDSGSWCFIQNPEMLSILKANSIEVHNTHSIPGGVTPERVSQCTWPDGFYKSDHHPQVYYLFSASASEPTWYGIGLGSQFCSIPNESKWSQLVSQAGGNGSLLQESLHRIGSLAFLGSRSEIATCPSRMVRGVLADSASAAAPATRSASSSWSHLARGLTTDVGDGWVIGTNTVGGGKGIFQLTGNSWSPIPGGGVRIGGPSAEPWVVNNGGHIYRWSNGTWSHTPGSNSKLASDVGHGWIIAENEPTAGGSKIYRFDYAANSWVNIPGGAVAVGGTYQQPWIANDRGDVFRYVNNSWKFQPGVSAVDIGDGWAVTKDQRIYRFNFGSNRWDIVEGRAVRVGGTYDNPLVQAGDAKVYSKK